jgi:hypothetical protein
MVGLRSAHDADSAATVGRGVGTEAHAPERRRHVLSLLRDVGCIAPRFLHARVTEAALEFGQRHPAFHGEQPQVQAWPHSSRERQPPQQVLDPRVIPV